MKQGYLAALFSSAVVVLESVMPTLPDHQESSVKRKDELVQKATIPQATYDKIKDQIVAKQK